MRSRRGLSTVVGAVFFVIAATTVISYVSYSMNTIDQFAESVIVKEAENINRGLEDITISQVTIVGGEFNMTVVNTGSLPVHLTRLWVTDDNSAVPDKKADLDVRINPGKEAIKIGEGTGIVADSTNSYSLKLVTERGNLATYSVSPDIPLQIQLVAPGAADLSQSIRLTAYYTNNSTKPNNVANLVPEMDMNTTTTLTLINGPLPPSIKTLPQGNTAVFTWTYQAPALEQGVSFNASYTGAPTGSFVYSNTTVAKSGEAEAAGTSQWSQAAKRVGILISGIPNPVEAAGGGQTFFGKWGIGIINPLNRPVEIYSVGVLMAVTDILDGEPDATYGEPINGWRKADLGVQSMAIWEGGGNPVVIPAKEVGQFRMETAFDVGGADPRESQVIIQALSSEGKLSTIYTISAHKDHPTINVFYTNDTSEAYPTTKWGYLIKDLKSGTNDQVFNATVENSADNTLTSEVKLIILLPADFTDIKDGNSPGWDAPIIITNPDGSTVINVNTTATSLTGESQIIYNFTADIPTVSETKLYVFQTTAIYPDWDNVALKQIQLASALSEAGVEVDP